VSLHDQLFSDIDDVFMDTSEFATEHVINNRSVTCVFDGNNLDQSGDLKAQNIYGSTLHFFVEGAELGVRPAAGSRLIIDNKPYSVVSCIENFGVLEITVGVSRA
jgi:hypothetical protein